MEQQTYLSAKEIAHYVKENLEEKYTVKGITALLHRLGFSYKKPKHTPSKADLKAQEEFIKQYEQLKKKKQVEDTIIFRTECIRSITHSPLTDGLKREKKNHSTPTQDVGASTSTEHTI